MNFSFWSDEDRLFVRRKIGLGWSINFKHIARKLGLIKEHQPQRSEQLPKSETTPESREDRLRRQIEASKYEDRIG